MLVSKPSVSLSVLLGLLICSFNATATVNPFKKTKDYVFGDEVAWYFKDGAAIKSGSEADGSDMLYYHLNITKNQLRLRFSKNDPGGELPNTRAFDDLEIIDVKLDGQRMTRFQQCLDTQSTLASTLKQNTVVANGTCVNEGGGEFVMLLDEASKDRLMQARVIEFVTAPYGRPVKMNYSLGGFARGYGPIIAPPPPPPEPKPVAVVAPKPEPRPVIKTCFAEAPADLQAVVKSIAYVCDDNAKKATAEASIRAQVSAERKKRKDAEDERLRLEAERKKEEAALNAVESDWEKKQAEIWVERCQKHWAKGTSPCYCAPYIDQAPAGVENACTR